MMRSTGDKKIDILLGGGFEKGQNIIFMGKSFTGTNTFPLYLVAKGLERGEGGVIITIDKPYIAIMNRLSDFTKNIENAYFIDLYSIPTGFMDFEAEHKNVVFLENRKNLNSILNIIKKVTENMDRYRIFIPLSSLLLFSSPIPMSDFVEKVSALIRTHGSLGFYILNSGMHEERIIEMFKRLSDGVFEFSEREGMHYFRVIGIPKAKTASWVEFHISKYEITIESFTISKIR